MTGEQIMREVFMAGAASDASDEAFQAWMHKRGAELLLYIIFGKPESEA